MAVLVGRRGCQQIIPQSYRCLVRVRLKVLRHGACCNVMDAIRRWAGHMSESRAPDGLEILTDMDAWRATHPTATLAKMEIALDERLIALRRRMLADTMVRSDQAIRSARPPAERPGCPTCGVSLRPHGKRKRQIRSAGGRCADGVHRWCLPSLQRRALPLDAQLALLPGQDSPTIQAMLVRLGAWMPFARAAALMRDVVYVTVSEGTTQRRGTAARMTAVVQQTLAARHIGGTVPLIPVPTVPMQVRADATSWIRAVPGEHHAAMMWVPPTH